MDKKERILQYCREQNKTLTARNIVDALYPGKKQPYVNSEINLLVQEKKLVRVETKPAYTVHIPKPDEVIPKPRDYSRGLNSSNGYGSGHWKPTMEIPCPSPTEADKYIKAWDDLENYRLQESALDKLFFELCPENKYIEDILIKVAALNDFYSTNIFTAYPVANKILSLNIDERLAVGDLSLVNDIATVEMSNGAEKNFYSFATKYCSHHQPKKYAIYDSYVNKILRYFRGRDHFARFADSELKNYPRFNAVLNQFRKFYGLEDYDLKMTDRYLWQLGKAAFPREFK